tara:strand:- start:359 stop:922 length:564 start_codon:yes stop_codon:yes gene_type:complete
MHNYFKIYYFIDQFNLKELSGIKKKINIIFRQYNKKYDLNEILKTKNYCKKKGFNLFLANNIRLASKLNLNGVYIPSFNKKINYKNVSTDKNFKIIGSAHNLREVKIKESQNCSEIFISPLFKTKKNNSFLDIIKFNFIAIKTEKKIVALGGINFKNLNRINMTKSRGVASISWIKKNGLNKNLGRF